MEAEALELWIQFQENALGLWRSASSRTGGGHQADTLFAIRSLPSFANPVSWTVCRHSGADKGSNFFLGLRREWKRDADFAMFESPLSLLRYKQRGTANPQISDVRLNVELTAIEPLLHLLGDGRIALAIDQVQFGLDGVGTELQLGDTWAGITLTWWGDGPASWRWLAAAVASTLDTLERIYRDQSDVG